MDEKKRGQRETMIATMKGLLAVAVVVGALGLAATSMAGLVAWTAPAPVAASAEEQPAPTQPIAAVPVLVTEAVATPALPEATPVLPEQQDQEPVPLEATEPVSTVPYTVQRGDTLASIAAAHGVALGELIRANRIVDPNVIYVGQTLQIPADGLEVPVAETPESPVEPEEPEATDPSAWEPIFVPADPAGIQEARWIDVDLSEQRVTAYEGQTPVRTTLASTGLPGTPTPEGQFRIWIKLRYDDMAGPGYYLEDVPYVMYFYQGYGLHGVFWHGNFGHPMSHGCVNLPTLEAEWLFNWAEVGTLVNVHE
jgi:lipoprotein-anchoring transpeptidase ErfK/SrfK